MIMLTLMTLPLRISRGNNETDMCFLDRVLYFVNVYKYT